jgi:hypothetical protein
MEGAVKQRERKRSATTPWLVHERLVAFLEQSIAPGSIVRHNVKMPVLGSKSRRRRQCDVVVLAGKPPRQTTTIVEVQKRGRKVGISDFHGWLAKMNEIGANQLICVSERGFSQDVVEAAAQHGSQVKLQTLDTSDARLASPPPVVMGHVMFRTGGKFEITEFDRLVVEGGRYTPDQPLMVTIKTDARVFSFDTAENRLSLDEVVAAAIYGCEELRIPLHVPLPPEVRVEMDLAQLGSTAWLHHGERKIQIRGCRVVAKVIPKREILPMDLTNVPYLEHGESTPLAWVSNATIGDASGSVELTCTVQAAEGGPLLKFKASAGPAKGS